MTERKRRRRDTRDPNPKPISLQPRDIEIVEFVHRHRVVSQVQLKSLFFGAAATPARDRLESLFDHHFLDRTFPPVYEGEGRSPTLYLLGQKGAELLRAKRGYNELHWYASSRDLKPDKLEHSLAINEVFLDVAFACKSGRYECRQWQTDNELSGKGRYDHVWITSATGKREEKAVIPDSQFIIVAGGRSYPFLLELDRGTMPLRRFKNKVKAYDEYYRSSGYEKRYNTKSMTVLTVVSTEARSGGEKRMLDLVAATEETTDKSWFWFTTLSKLTPETIFSAPIWHQVRHKEPKPLIPLA